MLRNAKRAHMQSLRPYDKKKFWKAVKFLTKKTSSIPELSCDGSIASSGTEKASMLNMFFLRYIKDWV